MKKPLFATIFLIIGLVIGGAIGVYYGSQKIGRPAGRFLVLGVAVSKGTNAMQLYKYADYLAARDALLDYANIMQDIAANPEYGDPRISRSDMALTFTRIALLEEAQGHKDQANEFMRRAVEEAKFTRWEDPTDKELRRFVEQVDKYVPSPKLK